MELTFDNILAGTRCLPKSFYDADDFLTTPPKFIQLTNQSLVRTPVQIDNQPAHTWGLNLNFKAAIGTIARFAAAFFMLSIHAAFGTVYHLICAVTRITMAFVLKSREPTKEDEAREDALHGCIHLVTAVYNLATMLLTPLVAVAYAATPDLVVNLHKQVYSETPATADGQPNGQPMNVPGTEVQFQIPKQGSYVLQAATSMRDAVMPHTTDNRSWWEKLSSPFRSSGSRA